MSRRWPLFAIAAALGVTGLVHWDAAYLPMQRLWGGLLAIVVLTALGRLPRHPWARWGMAVWVAAGVVAALLGPTAPPTALSLQAGQDLTAVAGMVLGLWFWHRRDDDSLWDWVWPLVGIWALAVGQGWLQIAGILPAGVDPYGAIDFAGGLGLSNFTAEWGVLVVALVAAAVAGREGPRWLVPGLALLTVGYAAVTGARTSLVAAGVAVAVPWALAGPRWRQGALAAAAIAGLAALVVWGGSDPSLQYRWLVQRDGLSMLVDQPLGAGVGGFSEGLDEVLSRELDRRSWERNVAVQSPHNWFVQAGAERGVLGLLLALGAVVAAGSVIWRKRRNASVRLLAGGLGAWLAIASASLAADVTAIWMLGAVLAGGLWACARPGDAPRPLPLPARGGVVVLALVLALIWWRQVVVESVLRSGLEAYASEKFVQAEKRLLDAAGREPGDYRPWFNMGVLRLRLKDPQGALDAFVQVTEARPSLARGHEVVTVLAGQQGRWDLVERSIDGWLDRPGEQPAALFAAAAMYYGREDRYDDALHLLDAGLQEHASSAELLRLKARVLMADARWNEAVPVLLDLSVHPQAIRRDAQWLARAQELATAALTAPATAPPP